MSVRAAVRTAGVLARNTREQGEDPALGAQVAVYVDGVRVGVAPASGDTPHHIIHRLCELDLARSELEQPPQQVGVGFRLRLPDLQQGRHEARPRPPPTQNFTEP